MYALYTVIGSLIFYALFPFFLVYIRLTGKYRQGLEQRLGNYSHVVREPGKSLRIWIHAASVGEVGVAEAVIEAFKARLPGCDIILSTVTEHGQALAKTRLPADVTCIFSPLDVFFPVRKAFAAIRPDVFICLETEIWPHLFVQAGKSGAVTAIINGRISGSAHKWYRRAGALFSAVLANIDIFSMISEADAERVRQLGVPADRVQVNGNAKFDRLSLTADEDVREDMRQMFATRPGRPVLVAGSTRGNEETILADVYRRLLADYPDMILILAPRHIQRTPEIVSMLKNKGLACRLKTEMDAAGTPRDCPVVVVDTIGDLRNIYSIATVAFCGGSLEPLGGQNPMEAAAWGVPVLFGPAMDDFAEVRDALVSNGGGIQVNSGEELAVCVADLLAHSDKARRTGEAAAKTALSAARAAEAHVRLVCQKIAAAGREAAPGR